MNLEFELIELRTRHAFHIARAAAPEVRRSVWVRLRDRDGLEGWGEAAPSAYYGETAETVVAVLPRLAAVLEPVWGDDAFALERLEQELERAVPRNAAARAAVSAALHDLAGKRLGVPVWRLWGLDPAAAPKSSFTIGLDEPERMRLKLREAAGYPILKVKLGTDRDEEVLRLLREEAPAATPRVDANTGWDVNRALAMLPLLEEQGIELIEQPLPPADLEGLRRVSERARIPIIADESCLIAADIPRLAGCVDGINIKLAKCGSLREALRMVHVARAHGLRVMLGCMVESTLGIAAAVQLAPLADYVDLDGAALLAHDPFRGPGLEPDGRLRFNTEPGLGVVSSPRASRSG
ncbi:MAG: dipeptide epimerase [Gemmatimonadetes bacterium]|nr:dipeptide epimerase [Gemmatimonadota bacterium]